MTLSRNDISAALSALRAMRSGKMALDDGCRAVIRAIGSSLEDPSAHDALVTLVVFDSEMDDTPASSARDNWSDDALARSDAATAAYLSRVRQAILDACKQLQTYLEALDIADDSP